MSECGENENGLGTNCRASENSKGRSKLVNNKVKKFVHVYLPICLCMCVCVCCVLCVACVRKTIREKESS